MDAYTAFLSARKTSVGVQTSFSVNVKQFHWCTYLIFCAHESNPWVLRPHFVSLWNKSMGAQTSFSVYVEQIHGCLCIILGISDSTEADSLLPHPCSSYTKDIDNPGHSWMFGLASIPSSIQGVGFVHCLPSATAAFLDIIKFFHRKSSYPHSIVKFTHRKTSYPHDIAKFIHRKTSYPHYIVCNSKNIMFVTV